MKKTIALLLLLSAPAHAAHTVASSDLPDGATPSTAADLGLRDSFVQDGYTKTFRAAGTAAASFCFADLPPGEERRWLSDSGTVVRYHELIAPDETLTYGVDRLVAVPDTPHLERATLHADPYKKTFAILRTVRIPLREVARSPQGVVVYGYRMAQAIHIVLPSRPNTRGTLVGDKGADVSDNRFFQSDCTFSDVRIPADGGSHFVQLTGRIDPPDAAAGSKPKSIAFVVNASVTKTSRDDAPILSVAIRHL